MFVSFVAFLAWAAYFMPRRSSMLAHRKEPSVIYSEAPEAAAGNGSHEETSQSWRHPSPSARVGVDPGQARCAVPSHSIRPALSMASPGSTSCLSTRSPGQIEPSMLTSPVRASRTMPRCAPRLSSATVSPSKAPIRVAPVLSAAHLSSGRRTPSVSAGNLKFGQGASEASRNSGQPTANQDMPWP